MRTIKIIGMAIFIGIFSVSALAESAPVYDADSVQQQFDNSTNDQSQDLPPPPPPGQENAFVPMQTTPVSTPAPSMPPLSTEQRIKRIEQQISNLQTSDSGARTDALQNQVQSLRDQVEKLTRQLEQLQTQQKSMYVDLDKRLSQQNARLNKPASTISSTSMNASDTSVDASSISAKSVGKAVRKSSGLAKIVSSSEDQPNVAEEQEIYQTAYNLIKAKKYADAVSALQKMLQKYPSGQFAANAHYWLGELYGLMSKNDLALTEFNTVVKTYPDSPRISDAQLKVGLIYASQLQWPEAKTAFKKVINRYPGTASARLASEQLKQIKQAGH